MIGDSAAPGLDGLLQAEGFRPISPGRRRPRIGFLGVGWIGRNRLDALARSGLVEVAALVDPVAENVHQALQSAPEAEPLESLDACLNADLDGIVIATPSALHAAQAVAALERGLAVFCQKPLARTGPETRQVVDAARRANRLLGVDLSYRHIAGVAEMRRAIRSGELGDLFAADLVFHNAYGPDKAWFYDRKLSGGGCLIDLGIHLVDLALWVLGLPGNDVEVVSTSLYSGGRLLTSHELAETVEDYAVASMRLGRSTTLRLACSWKLNAGYDALIEASFFGTRGGVSLRNVGGSFYDFTVERHEKTSRTALSTPPDDWGGRAAVAWATRLTRDAGYDLSVESILGVADTLDHIYAAGAYPAGSSLP